METKRIRRFENRKTEKLFADMHNALPKPVSVQFTKVVKKFYEEKVTGEKEYDTYLVTIPELEHLFSFFKK